jgi:hypothetical protein
MPMKSKISSSDDSRLDQIIATARQSRESRARDYREQALKLYPWICGRCTREFNRQNLQELTVHHRNHNHDYNPPDGSNWELLCLYCHDDEHRRYEEAAAGRIGMESKRRKQGGAAYRPFADLKTLLSSKEGENG